MSWHPWPVDRSWPSSAAEEDRFVADLVEAAARAAAPGTHERADVTVVVTALRNGATAGQVLGWVLGMEPGSLLAAYRVLDERMRLSLDAWRAIVEAPTTSSLTEHGPSAALLVPAAVGRMTQVMRQTSGAGLRLIAAKLETRIEETCRTVGQLERRMGAEADELQAREIGRKLFTPHGPCLYNEPLFLPSRVGQLSPQRVANLVAEDEPYLGAVAVGTG